MWLKFSNIAFISIPKSTLLLAIMIVDIYVIHANALFLLIVVETIQTSSERLNIYA